MIFETLQTLSIPAAYGHFRTAQAPPFVVYTGTGQDTFSADNTYTWSNNRYQIEYYFTKKNEEIEAEIEETLLGAGYNYIKSEDVYVESEGVYVIYYDV